MNIWYYTHRKTVIRVFFAVVFFLEYFLAGFWKYFKNNETRLV